MRGASVGRRVGGPQRRPCPVDFPPIHTQRDPCSPHCTPLHSTPPRPPNVALDVHGAGVDLEDLRRCGGGTVTVRWYGDSAMVTVRAGCSKALGSAAGRHPRGAATQFAAQPPYRTALHSLPHHHTPTAHSPPAPTHRSPLPHPPACGTRGRAAQTRPCGRGARGAAAPGRGCRAGWWPSTPVLVWVLVRVGGVGGVQGVWGERQQSVAGGFWGGGGGAQPPQGGRHGSSRRRKRSCSR